MSSTEKNGRWRGYLPLVASNADGTDGGASETDGNAQVNGDTDALGNLGALRGGGVLEGVAAELLLSGALAGAVSKR